MDKEKLTEIAKNPQDKTNKDLIESRDFLFAEFNKTKELIVELTRHLDTVQSYYEAINKEIGDRVK